VLGIAGGNGLDHVDPNITKRVVGLDGNPLYLDEVRRRYAGKYVLGLYRVDLAAEPVDMEPLQLVHAALVFDGGDCVGWCQFGAPDEVPKIKNRAAYEKSLSTLPDWRIACNFVGKGHRRQGVATAALRGALDLIARLGGGKVEGYPEAAGSVPAGFLFNGALSTYEKLGFVRDRKIGKHRWVVTKVVEPTS